MKSSNINDPMRAALKHFALAVTAGAGLALGCARAAAPPNDNFADAIALPEDSGSLTGYTTIDATFQVDEPVCIYAEATNTVWFKWTCTTNGAFTISTRGSTNPSAGEWDAVLGIYTGGALATLTAVPPTPQDSGAEESVNIAVSAGTTYYIQLAGDSGAPPQEATNIMLNWSWVPSGLVVDISDAIGPLIDGGLHINNVVGMGNAGRLVGKVSTYWNSHGFTVPLDLNGNTLEVNSGGGNEPFGAHGAISGAGALILDTVWDHRITVDATNSYSGTTLVRRGWVQLANPAGQTALLGTITVGGSDKARLVWSASNQLADASDVTLVRSGSQLDLAGSSDTINDLYLVAGTSVQTGALGVLKVAHLFINGVEQPEVAYIAGDGYVLGSGYIEVGASGPPVIGDPPATPINPIPALASTTANPAFLTKLEWDDCALASSYDVYFWLASAPDLIPGTDPPTATVSLSEYTLPAALISVTDYKWQVVAHNGIGNTPSEVWTFTTMDRRDISGEIAINTVVGAGNTGRLIGTATTGWWSGGFSVPLNLNENTLQIASGGGNPMNASGPIFGNGVVQVHAGGVGVLYITGSVGNTYTGTSVLYSGPVSLGKSSGNALCGTLTVQNTPSGNFPGMGNVIWTAADQISDTSDVSLVTSGAWLNLAGFTDTIAGLSLAAGTYVATGTGGVLTVSTLTVNGEVMGPGTYTVANSTFVFGTGSVVVPGGTAFDTWAAANAGGQSADLDFDHDGISNGVEYFMGATGSTFTPNPPVVTTAGVMTVTWPRDPTAVATFKVQVSDNLIDTDWTDILPSDPSIDETNPNQVTYTLPGGAPRKFCRLVVITP
ncbi:MAG: hypothetical protein NTW21_21130 [Verrucomicrobia bacterium]|nr:hypothetical protein [Verrucomicrobiota bacterium]